MQRLMIGWMTMGLLAGAMTAHAQDAAAPAAAPAAEPAAAEAPVEDAAAKAKRAFNLVQAKSNTRKNLEEAIAIYLEVTKDPSLDKKARVAAFTDLARAYQRLGDKQSTSSKKQAVYDKGVQAAADAVKLDSKHAMAYYWRAANMGAKGRAKGVLNSLFMVPDVKKDLKQCLALNKRAYYCRDLLARVLHKVPGLAGGSDSEAEKLFKQNIAMDPNFTGSKVQYAIFLIDDGREDEAKPLLQAVIDAKSPTYRSDWRKFDKPRAKAKLAEISK